MERFPFWLFFLFLTPLKETWIPFNLNFILVFNDYSVVWNVFFSGSFFSFLTPLKETGIPFNLNFILVFNGLFCGVERFPF